ncbi:4-alpha-glucanotransferase [Serratia fonticola]|uniref:4-alpha-glucanotransferase n=1 Tax=Serratia fonticola TaxID=47917 RepID=A0A4U9WQQ5_SERFO|nr:4-alpha-glucanotransferase [Serratia fonticola]
MVIGEDLGTVPVEIVGKLRDSGVYSYKVLYFEHDAEKQFRAPQSYPVAGNGDHYHPRFCLRCVAIGKAAI